MDHLCDCGQLCCSAARYIFFFGREPSRCVPSVIYYISAVNTQHMRRPDVLIHLVFARYIASKKCDIVCYPPDCTSLQQLLHTCIKKCFRHLYGKHLVQTAVCLMGLGKDITLKIIVCKQYTSQYWLGNKSHSWQSWMAFVILSVEMNFTQKLTLTPVLPWGQDSLLNFTDTMLAEILLFFYAILPSNTNTLNLFFPEMCGFN